MSEFESPVELRNELAKLVMKGSVTHRTHIEQHFWEIVKLKPELIRHGFLNADANWLGDITNYFTTLGRVLNAMGYATKSVRRTRGARTCKELACTLNNYTDLELAAKMKFRENILNEITRLTKELNENVIKLRHIG